MKIFNRLVRDERGTAAVEFTMVLPIMLVLVFGIVELGSAWQARQTLTNASREGARLGSVHASEGVTADEIVQTVETFLTASGFTGTGINVALTGAGSGFTTGDQVTVEVTADWSLPVLSSLLPNTLGTVTLGARTVMRHE